MKKLPSKTKCIGILTSGGDCPGLNAAIRGIAKAAINIYGMKVIGIRDGFRGLVENRTVILDDRSVSGILTQGGTFLGTSRDKPRKMRMGGKKIDMTEAAAENVRKMQIDCLVCLGGGGTQKNAYHLHKETGINVLTLPKTIDNDVGNTDTTFGFHTAMDTAVEAIDRLHTTALSHQRTIICEVMGHNSGWLALGSGIAGGADVILIPEIPYELKTVAESLIERRRNGKKFSIIILSEGALSENETEAQKQPVSKTSDIKKTGRDSNGQKLIIEPKANSLARRLEEVTGIEARVTNLGHILRGGIPSAGDRHLCTMLGAKAAELLAEGSYNLMVAVKGDKCVPVPISDVAGKKKTVPPGHSWIKAARMNGVCFGDE
ncbi:MAG: 6-phosphofructokinase [Fibrobacterota bacterium]